MYMYMCLMKLLVIIDYSSEQQQTNVFMYLRACF